MDESPSVSGVILTGLLIVAIIVTCAFALPIYGVWSAGQDGQAALARATYDRQVAVVEAEAKNASASYEAQAEITRAYGVAKANQIIGDSLKDNQDYLRYLWVNNLENSHNQVIYVPTETGMPILEASRLQQTNRVVNNG